MASANTRLDSLGALLRNEANLLVRCKCGSEHVIDARRFQRYCLLRNWNDQLETLTARLRCRQCGARPIHLRATPAPATLVDPFPRDERGWRMLQRRLRD